MGAVFLARTGSDGGFTLAEIVERVRQLEVAAPEGRLEHSLRRLELA